MRSVEEQQARVAAAAVAPRPVRVAIAESQGLMCAEEVVTERPLPGFDQAAIDGYAVRSVDVLSVGGTDDDGLNREISLPVVGDIAAGARTPSRLQPRQAGRAQLCRLQRCSALRELPCLPVPRLVAGVSVGLLRSLPPPARRHCSLRSAAALLWKAGLSSSTCAMCSAGRPL